MPDDDETPQLHNVAILGYLTRLTSLQLDMTDRKPDDFFWRSLAYLTTLRSLRMSSVDYDCLGGVGKLRDCQQLTLLAIDHDDFWPELKLEVGCVLCVHELGCSTLARLFLCVFLKPVGWSQHACA